MSAARRIPLAALALVAGALGGCAGQGRDHAAAPGTPPGAAVGSAARVTVAELRRRVDTRFRAKLLALATMSQPRDAGADLGQDVPAAGLLEAVACQHRRCSVRWRSPTGGRIVTRYDVRRDASGCLVAVANPPRISIFDATGGSYAENPLNALALAAGDC